MNPTPQRRRLFERRATPTSRFLRRASILMIAVPMAAPTTLARIVRLADTRTLAEVANSIRIAPGSPFQLWPRAGTFIWWDRLRVTHWQRKFGLPPGFLKHEGDTTPALKKALRTELAECALLELTLCCHAALPPELLDLLRCWTVLLRP